MNTSSSRPASRDSSAAGTQQGGGQPPLRLLAVMPAQAAADAAVECLDAFCQRVDVAAVLLATMPTEEEDAASMQDLAQALVHVAQAHGAAALVREDVNACRRLGADGVHVEGDAPDRIRSLRRMLGDEMIIGACCPLQRHVAMELAEAGADYLGIDQRVEARGENLLAWWAQMFTVPVVAMLPAAPQELPRLWRQGADFAVPLPEVWEDAARAAALAEEYAEALRQLTEMHA